MRLGRALAECEGDNGVRASVRIVGFASRKGPENNPSLYDDANLTAANTRAQNVKIYIEQGAREKRNLGPLPVDVQVIRWTSYRQLERDLRFWPASIFLASYN